LKVFKVFKVFGCGGGRCGGKGAEAQIQVPYVLLLTLISAYLALGLTLVESRRFGAAQHHAKLRSRHDSAGGPLPKTCGVHQRLSKTFKVFRKVFQSKTFVQTPGYNARYIFSALRARYNALRIQSSAFEPSQSTGAPQGLASSAQRRAARHSVRACDTCQTYPSVGGARRAAACTLTAHGDHTPLTPDRLTGRRVSPAPVNAARVPNGKYGVVAARRTHAVY
jgi:hypothetical protein